jgi:hypothetical protein
VLIDVLARLQRNGDVIVEYELCCADGHIVWGGTENPLRECECSVCGEHIDPNDDLTYVVYTRYVLRVT